MTSTKLAADAIARRVGLPKKRVGAVGVALTEVGVLPAGSPGKSPQLEPEHVVSLLIGSCLDVPLRAVADAVRAYRVLGLPGHDASGMPAAVAHRFHDAGTYLDVLADMASRGTLEAQSDVSHMKIEIATSENEIAIHHPDGEIQRFQPSSTLHGHWQAHGHRASVMINGSAFVSTMCDLFGGKK